MTTSHLTVERKSQADETPTFAAVGATIQLSPELGEAYWAYRVLLSDRQAVVGFPKFTTIGIGFAVEDAD